MRVRQSYDIGNCLTFSTQLTCASPVTCRFFRGKWLNPGRLQSELWKMGKGGYGKGWSRGKPWQNGPQQWRHQYPAQQNYQQWHHTYQHQPAEPSLGRLCTGVLSSAWEGLCSGVTAATLKAVENTANAFLKPKTEQQVEKEKVEDHGAKSIMACLAGKSAEPVPATEKAAEKAPASMPDQLMLSVLELQREQMQQQTLFQQQLLCLQNASLAPSAAAEQTSKRKPSPVTRKKTNPPKSAVTTPTNSPTASKPGTKRGTSKKLPVKKGRLARPATLPKTKRAGRADSLQKRKRGKKE